MRTLIIGAAALSLLGAASLTGSACAAPADDAVAPIGQFVEAFDKGDLKGAAATTDTANLTIIDEAAPYVWKGPTALADWARDLLAGDAKAGINGESVAISKATRVEVDGDNAYVIVPAVYSFKNHGAAMSEPAQMTYALHKGADGWKIEAWTWTGPRATPAK